MCACACVWALRRFVWLCKTFMPCQPADSWPWASPTSAAGRLPCSMQDRGHGAALMELHWWLLGTVVLVPAGRFMMRCPFGRWLQTRVLQVKVYFELRPFFFFSLCSCLRMCKFAGCFLLVIFALLWKGNCYLDTKQGRSQAWAAPTCSARPVSKACLPALQQIAI